MVEHAALLLGRRCDACEDGVEVLRDLFDKQGKYRVSAHKHTKDIGACFPYSLAHPAGRNLAPLLKDKESCMTHSICDDRGSLIDPLRNEPLPRAKPHERLTHGMNVEDFFGICSEEFDDEFMESLREVRRGVWTTKEVP
jgi:hypothetical protein